MASTEPVKIANGPVAGRKASAEAEASLAARVARSIPTRWWPYLLVLTDVVLIYLAFVLAYFVRYEMQWFRAVDPVFQLEFHQYRQFSIALILILPISFYFSGVYPYRPGRSLVEELYAIGTATTAGILVLITVALFFRPLLYSRLIFLYAAFLIIVLLGVSRLTIQAARAHLRRYGVGVERMVLVGAGDVGRMVMRNVVARPELGYQLIGFLDDDPAKSSTDIGPFRALGPVDNFAQVTAEEDINSVIICLPWQSHRTLRRVLRACDQAGVRAYVVPDLFQITRNQMKVESLNGIPLISTRQVSIQGWNLVLKRASDLVLSAALGLVTLPFILLMALAIRLDSPGPVLYSQVRVGKEGKRFRCFKFRTMVVGADKMRRELDEKNEASGPLFKMRNDPRLTQVGRFLRRYSLDELPQLINIFRGEMSLVGPRPNLPEEVDQYLEWHKKRLAASPGITGLWQVSGRSDLSFDEMVLLDIYYVENWNLGLDFVILLRSIPAVLGARGAY